MSRTPWQRKSKRNTSLVARNRLPAEPGDVVIGKFGSHKSRPWLVLFIKDNGDEEDEALLVALTKSAKFPTIIETGHKLYAHAAAWCALWPVRIVEETYRAPDTFTNAQRARVEDGLARAFDLRTN